jgi:hypothetical protein
VKKLLVLFALAALLSGCGSLESNKGEIMVTVNDGIMRNVVGPGDALLIDNYYIHVVGTAGGCVGQSFDEVVSGAGGSFSRQVTTGTWAITVNAWNKATPKAIIATGSGIAEVKVGVPASPVIIVTETVGDGTLIAEMQWYPNVIQVPQPKITVKKYGGAPQVLTLDSQDSTHAAASDLLSNGWYVGFFEIRDAGTLAAGVVQAFRILKDYTTTWTENLQVNLLEGTITVHLQYQDGRPLVLVCNTPEGDVGVFTDEPKTISVISAGQDSGKGLLYAWYLDGQATSLGDLDNFVVNPGSYPEGSIHYLSAVVFQDDGARAASANWKVTMAGMNPSRASIAGICNDSAFSTGVAYTVELISAVGHAPVDSQAMPYLDDPTRDYNLGVQVVGDYHLRVVIPAGGDFPLGKTVYWPNTTNVDLASVITIPHALGAVYSFTADALLP